jgi:hypothetical protein
MAHRAEAPLTCRYGHPEQRPVAADAVGAMLFGRKPEDIGFIRIARNRGWGP